MEPKRFEKGDPMVLVGMALPEGDSETMTECFVEEFLRLGFDRDRLLELFRNPFYVGAHALYLQRGEGYVRDVISRVVKRFNFKGGEHA